ncbi:MAG TPA: hypothetical protein VH560_01220 [Polyangia bacterium]|jgi:hypothetical protein|nr:hypothetical protein [Polyangia bacterium]
MGDSLCLQAWTSVSGNNSTLVQDASDWLDVSHAQDLAIYAEIGWIQSQASTTLLDIQASPTKDAAFFTSSLTAAGVAPYLARYSFALTPTLGMQTLAIVRFATVTASPPSCYLRWAITFPNVATGTNLTFRIWINANRGGY